MTAITTDSFPNQFCVDHGYTFVPFDDRQDWQVNDASYGCSPLSGASKWIAACEAIEAARRRSFVNGAMPSADKRNQ